MKMSIKITNSGVLFKMAFPLLYKQTSEGKATGNSPSREVFIGQGFFHVFYGTTREILGSGIKVPGIGTEPEGSPGLEQRKTCMDKLPVILLYVQDAAHLFGI